MADNKLAKTEDAALATTGGTALAPRPDRLKGNDRRGMEDMSKEDMLIPRLALAQALSPEVTDGDPNRVPDLKVGDLFNSVTKQIYGRSVDVQIIRKDKLRAMEFNPIEDGGGVKDPNVPLNDERCKWGEDGEKPRATLFRDYVAVLLPSREMIALSFKSSGIAVAKGLNGLIALRNAPIWEGIYRITTAVELKPKPHQVYRAANSPLNGGWVADSDSKLGEQMYLALKDLDLAGAIERDGEDDAAQPGAAGAHEEM